MMVFNASDYVGEAIRQELFARCAKLEEECGDLGIEVEHYKGQRDDLLKALKDLLAVVNVRIDDPRIAQFDAARAAIKKAEGAA
jgi:hypothetical protein